ncbi:uncharacterized protein EV422DRAFT_270626 [Fimicolochytrium jonesii]|uniref:uncharacterized protein n=1 Tax=Fimicolochytrium jonesii TaxID=1396493 RepID=UPI0022FECA81|nr:uncharacterized protein EV422DRAFT_270626 [Fimicolochytrium jonesii]KAI8816814.1 hypothetical protein EV422DRAFT_270626 [Fimicolochytrium jonesii]
MRTFRCASAWDFHRCLFFAKPTPSMYKLPSRYWRDANCKLGEMCQIMSLLEHTEPVYVFPNDRRMLEQAEERNSQFVNTNGDHMTILEIMKRFRSTPATEQRKECREQGLAMGSCAEEKRELHIRKALVQGFSLQLAVTTDDDLGYTTAHKRQSVRLGRSYIRSGRSGRGLCRNSLERNKFHPDGR